MEKESFQDQEIADILNQFFVAIKVDREERPDIDQVYMKMCHAVTGRGGWPLTVLLKPDKKPFFVGTYLPKEDYYGRTGLKRILHTVAKIWRTIPEQIAETAENMVALLESVSALPEKTPLHPKTVEQSFSELQASYDPEYGGFDGAPKFPLPMHLFFLLHFYQRRHEKEALSMVQNTLVRMRLGGIYDQIGGGFHRYATDRSWFLPHFEKMLPDNALLLFLYSEMYRTTKEEFYRMVCGEIFHYLTRELLAPQGAFYAAQDADSDGEEGKFYTYTVQELRNILEEEEFARWNQVFPVREEGNFLMESTGRLTGRNIVAVSPEIAGKFATSPSLITDLLTNLRIPREKIFLAREKRSKPSRDENILTDWNALAIVALAKASLVLDTAEPLRGAERCFHFLATHMLTPEKTLRHHFSEDRHHIEGFLEDYAYTIWALIELYAVTLSASYLTLAVELTDQTVELFWDGESGGFYHRPYHSEPILIRSKDIADGALPSGNAVMAYNLLRLGRTLRRKDYEDRAQEILHSFSAALTTSPSSHPLSMITLDLLSVGTTEMVIVSLQPSDEVTKMVRTLYQKYSLSFLPLFREETTESLAPWCQTLSPIPGKTIFYLCEKFTCREPLDLETLLAYFTAQEK